MEKQLFAKLYLYPILFPSILVLTLAGANLIILTYWEIAKYTLVFSALAGLFLALTFLYTRNGARSAFLVFLVTMWAFYYGTIVMLPKSYLGLSMSVVQQIIFLMLWTGFIGFVGSPWLWRRVKKPAMVTTYFNIFSILLILFFLLRILQYQSRKVNLANYNDTFPMISDLHTDTQPPDIYYIILDSYGQSDTLADLYSWNNQDFIDYLEKKGFYVAHTSQTNYVQTALSLPSSLNFDYLPNLPSESRDGRPLIKFVQQNRIMRIMESLGYQTYAFQTPYESASITRVDHFYTGVKMLRTNALIGLLMTQSVASIGIELNWITPPFSTYGEQQDLVMMNLAELVRLSELPGPKFVFLHIILPHEPFIFNQDGPITPNSMYLLSDTILYTKSVDQFIKGYTSQAEYLNTQLEKTINKMLENSTATPIIILQGDHGPGAYFAQTMEETCLKERLGILNAYLLPDNGIELLYPSISPVNTFRVILDAYFGGKLGLLEDKQFYSNFTHPYQFIDVGEVANQACNVPSSKYSYGSP